MMFRTVVVAAILLSAVSASAQSMDTVRIAGWSKPISEITNILAEPDKGFFKAQNIARLKSPFSKFPVEVRMR